VSSSETAIKVRSLSKQYLLGAEPEQPHSLKGRLQQTLSTPFRWLSSQFRAPSEQETLWALRDVSFDVQRGEVVGIIGHNGAGKSTLLKILSRITEPSSGYAEIHGRIAALLEVGTGMHPELTGRENIFMNGTVLGMKKREIQSKFDEIVEFSGVGRFLDTPVKRYSSGMRVRLGFAIAAHLEPEILIIDEVLAVGDAAFQQKCLGKMQDVSSHGRTVLFVSHNMAAVENLCSRAIVMDRGSIAFSGSTQEAINEYVQLQDQSTGTPLSERGDREGNGSFRFSKVTFLSTNGKTINHAISGKPLAIEIKISCEEHLNLKTTDIHVTFYSSREQYMFTCSTAAAGSNEGKLTDGTVLLCTIAELPLTAGLYVYNVYGTVGGITADWVRKAGTLSVIEGDFFGTGKIIGHPGGFLVRHSWNTEAPQAAAHER